MVGLLLVRCDLELEYILIGSKKLEVDDTAGIVGIKEVIPPVKIPVDDGLGRQARRLGRVLRPGPK